MASITEFILKWISDTSGLQNTIEYMKKAEAESRAMASQLTKDAKFITANTTRFWNQQGQTIDITTSTFSQAGKQFNVVTRNIGGNVEFMKASLKSAFPVVDQVVMALRRAIVVVPIWNAFRFAYTQVISLINDSVKFIADWEYQLAQIRIVANDSEEAIQNLSYSLLSLAKNLGISTKDLGEGAKLYAQQGRSIQEIIPLMKATAKLSMLSGRTMVQSVEDMTAVLEAYNFQANQATQVIDAISKVMLVHAIDANDLASAYKAVASTASSLGVSFEALTGYITAIKAVTRDAGSKIGESLRTIFSRITTVSAEAIQRLTNIPLFLDQAGNVTKTVTANFRDLDTVIAELAVVFKTLGTAQQSELAQLIGGTRRINQVMALFNNYTEAIKAQASAMFSLEEADKAIAILTDTVRIKIDKLTGSWQNFVESASDTGWWKNILTILTTVIDGFTLTANRTAYLRTEFQRFLDDAQQQATYQELFAQQVGNTTEKINNLIDSMKAGRIPIEDVQTQVGLLINALNTKGLKFNFQIENLNDPIKVLEELKQKAGVVKDLELEAKINIQRGDLKKQLVDVVADIEKAGKTFLPALRFSDLWKDLTIISEETPKKIAKLQQEMNKVLKTPEQKQAFQELIDQYQNIQKVIRNTSKLQEEATKVIAQRENEQASRKLRNILTDEQVSSRIQSIEEQATITDRERIDVVREELALLNSTNVILNDDLENKRDQLKLEELRLQKADERRNIETRYLKMVTDLKEAGASSLQLLIQEKAYLDAINASQEKRVDNERKIYEARKQLVSTTEQSLINSQIEFLQMQGFGESQSIQATILLEQQLGLERQGLDALKQKLDLVKAITREQQISKETRLEELESLIKTTEKEKDLVYQARLKEREIGLVKRARELGISQEKINQIIEAPKLEEHVRILGQQLTIDLPTELKRMADPLNSQVFQLTDAIKVLTNTILNQATKAPLAVPTTLYPNGQQQIVHTQIQRQTLQPEAILSPVTSNQIAPPSSTLTRKLPNISLGTQQGVRGMVEINIGDRTTYLSTSLTDKQIKEKVQSIVKEEDEAYISRISRRVGELIRTPETELNKSIIQVFNGKQSY